MPLEHAILAFLDFQPMTGYDLKKYFDQSVGHFWSATQSHIYKALDGLEDKGFAAAQLVVQESAPNRKEYHITSQGQAELRRWLITPLPLKAVREDWLIQVFFSHFSSNDEIAALLEARAEGMRERLETYRQDAQAAIDENARRIGVDRARELWQITLDYGIAYYEHELAWLEETVARARSLPPLTPPANP
ncbi:MAG: PadR family transcriptional regulator [Anaerolineae bacterium]|nr:PadR family transcriptional regulator [Anaerolineae bacterium]